MSWGIGLAKSKVQSINSALDELKEFKLVPDAQIKDIQNTLDRIVQKAQLKHEKQMRRESNG